MTTREVLEEVRDQRSLQYIQTLPFPIETAEPSEDAVKAVLKFARATGDIHSLSRADVRLIALAYTLECKAHGAGHLRAEPGERKIVKHRKGNRTRGLPGWDFVTNEAEWAELDELEGDTSQPQAESRILGSGAASTSAAVAAAVAAAEESMRQEAAEAAAAKAAGFAPADGSDSESDGEEAGGWAVAKKERARRRAQRKELRGKAAEELAQIEQARAVRALEVSLQSKARVSEGVQLAGWARPAAAPEDVPASAVDVDAPATSVEAGSDVKNADAADDDEEREEGEYFEVVSVSGGSESDGEGEGTEDAGPGFESSIQSVTADFAMQNVILQMGLRLTARDGRCIRELSRYALRCSACYAVTKEMTRIFCPRCGNQALDKVTITVGPDGMEQFGVKKRHVLRGTRYSLPKPKGGRLGSQVNPILREDVLMSKAGKKIRKKLPTEAEGDPFAPEFNDETWHKVNQITASKGIAFATAGHKNNPNDRKFHRSNRRR